MAATLLREPARACLRCATPDSNRVARAGRLDGKRPNERTRLPHSPHTRARAALPMVCATRILPAAEMTSQPLTYCTPRLHATCTPA